jgi:hypothetical protein
MSINRNHRITFLLLLFSLPLLVGAASAASLRGRITDATEGLVPDAKVVLSTADGKQWQQKTNETGTYEFRDLATGVYQLRVERVGFALFENLSLSVDNLTIFNLTLEVATQNEEVSVESESQGVTTDQSQNAGALVLKDKNLDSLSDDPDELAAELQALAGPGAGPNGGQVSIDGFTGGTLPPKSSIREIRVNSNPFSAEFDRVGYNRIEILTKPGADKFRGEARYGFSDDFLNSRNPFAEEKAPFQSRQFGARLSGPISKKSSFSVGFESRNVDENSLINAVVLDGQLQPLHFNQTLVTPQLRINIDSRLDYQLNDKNTVVTRYRFTPSNNDNMGAGNFDLPSRTYSQEGTEHELQMTETAILNAHTVNETKFQYRRSNRSQTAASNLMVTDVSNSFTDGGSTAGNTYQLTNSFELQNFTSYIYKTHTFKVGGRVRYSSLDDNAPNNFNGTYKFNTLEQYQITKELQGQLVDGRPYTPDEIRAAGGGASQFTINTGTALAEVGQVDVGLFGTWDWQVRPSMTLSSGLRWEDQSNISNHNNFAPRVGLAWALDGGNGKTAKTILRLGAGLFYDRVNSNLTLQATRLNGTNQRSYSIQDPNFYPYIPSQEVLDLPSNQKRLNTYELANSIRTPYSIQTSVGIERQLPHSTTIAGAYVFSRGVHLLRTRDLDPGVGGQYVYESSGLSRENQFRVNFKTSFTRKISLFGWYVLGQAYSDTEGGFPADPNNLHIEWGPSGSDVRHRMMLGGSYQAWRGISLNPFVTASTGSPFNITTGNDLNGDGQFNDRPAFASSADDPNAVRHTAWGDFLTNPQPGYTPIPRNYGRGPGSFMLNLRVGKTWGLGRKIESASSQSSQGAPPPGAPMGGGDRRGPGGMDSSNRSGQRCNLTLSVQASNLLNNVNVANPVGSLNSFLFGQSTQLAGGRGGPGGSGGSAAYNRRIELQLRFTF